MYKNQKSGGSSRSRTWILAGMNRTLKPLELTSHDWQGHEGLNLNRQFWRLLSCHWTIPLHGAIHRSRTCDNWNHNPAR